jgi:hypothetical protein
MASAERAATSDAERACAEAAALLAILRHTGGEDRADLEVRLVRLRAILNRQTLIFSACT